MGLCLSRKTGERIILDARAPGRTVITVYDQGDGKVKLYFEADRKTVSVLREELVDRQPTAR